MRSLHRFWQSVPSRQPKHEIARLRYVGLALVLGIAGYTACFNPDIKSGQIACNPDITEKRCPDDFTCDTATNKCVTKSGTGGTAGTAPGGTGGQQMCVQPIAGCVSPKPATFTCDTACQTGCACNQRCALGGGVVACSTDTGGKKTLGESCGGDGPKVAFEDCSPGFTCLEEYETVCGKHCFRYCHDDTDCPSKAHCTVELTVSGKESGVFVCDNPPETCSPIYSQGNCGRADRPSPQFGCYIMGGQYPNQAVCDCAGTFEEDQPCELERECRPGLVCIDTGGGKGQCKRVCPLRIDAEAKLICLTKTCTAYRGSVAYGYCK